MQRTLSLRYTSLLKFVLPPVWIGLLGYVVWQLWSRPEGVLVGHDPGPEASALKWLLLGLMAVSLAVLFAFVVPLKRLRLAADGPQISTYVRETTVPFGAITTVRQNWLPTLRLITLELRARTTPGRRVIFMPAGRQRIAFWRATYWSEDELVSELRRLAGLTD